MKKVKLLTSVLLLTVSANMSAQFSNSSASSSFDSNGWNTIYVQWNPSQSSPDKGDSQSFTGLSLGYSRAFSVSNSIPLFVEAGLGLQYSHFKESEGEDDDDYGTWELTTKFNGFSAKVPVRVMYNWEIPNSKISIAPFVGLNARFNFSAKSKIEETDEGYDRGSYTIDHFKGKITDVDYPDDYEDNISKDQRIKELNEYIGDLEKWKRFQIGWELGVQAKFNNKFLLGVSYGQDFSEISKKVKIHTTSITLGYCF